MRFIVRGVAANGAVQIARSVRRCKYLATIRTIRGDKHWEGLRDNVPNHGHNVIAAWRQPEIWYSPRSSVHERTSQRWQAIDVRNLQCDHVGDRRVAPIRDASGDHATPRHDQTHISQGPARHERKQVAGLPGASGRTGTDIAVACHHIRYEPGRMPQKELAFRIGDDTAMTIPPSILRTSTFALLARAGSGRHHNPANRSGEGRWPNRLSRPGNEDNPNEKNNSEHSRNAVTVGEEP